MPRSPLPRALPRVAIRIAGVARILSTCAGLRAFGSPVPAHSNTLDCAIVDSASCGAQRPPNTMLQGAALASRALHRGAPPPGRCVALEVPPWKSVVQHKRVVTQMRAAPDAPVRHTPLAPYQPVHRFVAAHSRRPGAPTCAAICAAGDGDQSLSRVQGASGGHVCVRASMTRATIMATTRSRRRLAGRADEGMQVRERCGDAELFEDGGDIEAGAPGEPVGAGSVKAASQGW